MLARELGRFRNTTDSGITAQVMERDAGLSPAAAKSRCACKLEEHVGQAAGTDRLAGREYEQVVAICAKFLAAPEIAMQRIAGAVRQGHEPRLPQMLSSTFAEEELDRGEAGIAGTGRVSALPFQIVQEIQDETGVKLFDLYLARPDAELSGGEACMENEKYVRKSGPRSDAVPVGTTSSQHKNPRYISVCYALHILHAREHGSARGGAGDDPYSAPSHLAHARGLGGFGYWPPALEMIVAPPGASTLRRPSGLAENPSMH